MSSSSSSRASVLVLLCVLAACPSYTPEPNYGSLSRDPRKFTFEHNIELFETTNGMRFALIRDTRTNLATIDLRYRVGAAEDPPGRAGMAHLVEHLLFELRGKPGGPTLGDELGELALHHNASTTWDHTHYTATVPVEQLDAAIALEGRRLRARCDQLDDATFARERAVVLAETAQRAGASDRLWFDVLGAVYGASHPYARSLSANEIAGATKEEVCAFVAAHYGPARALLVVTGPIDADRVRATIGRTFGPILAGAATPRAELAAPGLAGGKSVHRGPVDHPTAVVFLPLPAWGAPGTVAFRVARSRLASALAEADEKHRWIEGTGVVTAGGGRAPVLAVIVEVSGESRLGDAVDEVFARAEKLFTSSRDLRRLKDRLTLDYVEAWDDPTGRGEWIASFMEYTDHNWFMLQELGTVQQLSLDGMAEAVGERFRRDRSHVAHVLPDESAGAQAIEAAVPTGTHDVAVWRAPVDAAEADRPLAVDLATVQPPGERFTLRNGLAVILAPDRTSPVVDARLVLPIGRAHEPADQPLIASAAAGLLEVDYESKYTTDALERLYWALTRGTVTDWDVDETSTTFSARGLSHWGEWHVWQLSWLMEQGRYNQETMEALQAAAVRGGKEDIDADALAFNQRLFGAEHPYATPAPRAGAAFRALEADDLDGWRRRHFQPRGATLIVSGDFEPARMKRHVAELFAPWADVAPAPRPPVPPIAPAPGPSWLADDDAEATQIGLRAGWTAGSDRIDDGGARAVLTELLGEQLRVVREQLGASYGVYADYDGGAAGSAIVIAGQLDEAKAAEATRRILAMTEALARGQIDREAFVRARRRVLARLLARTGGAARIADLHAAIAGGDLPAGFLPRLTAQVAQLRPVDLARVARLDLATGRRVVQLRGRREALEPAFAALGVQPERPVREADAAARVADAEALDAAEAARAAGRLAVGQQYGLKGHRSDAIYQGDRVISVQAFLRLTGRTDRLERMQRRRFLRLAIGVTGLSLAVGGTIYAIAAARTCEEPIDPRDPEYVACVNARFDERFPGGVVAGIGVLGTLSALTLSDLRPSDRELRGYAAAYNRRNGIPVPDVSEMLEESHVQLAPAIGPDGAGLVLSGRF